MEINGDAQVKSRKMADATPQKRVLPARERRESAMKRRASSPLSKPATPASKGLGTPATPATPAIPAVGEDKPKRKYEKRVKTVHVSTPARSASTPTPNADEILPTRVTSGRPLPTSLEPQADNLPNKQYQSVVDSAILAASLHRSRMQWLCDGVFKKYWTKPVKRKKVIEEPPNNPDAKSMQKLGNATITIEPHTFDATFYIVKEPAPFVASAQTWPKPAPVKQSTYPGNPAPAAAANVQATVHAPVISNVPTPAPVSKCSPAPGTPTMTPSSTRPPTPPGGAKVNDPVIQMLASRAASDNNLKELMKVVATSKATPEQLKEFQAHIDEFNAIVKKQEAEREAKAKQVPAAAATAVQPIITHPTPYSTMRRNSPLNPTPTHPQFAVQPRPEPTIKHVIIEFTSLPSAGQSANTDRWLFPEFSVLDTQYGGTEMTCSFFIERKGSDVLASTKDLTHEDMRNTSNKWDADVQYYEPVTMVIKAHQHRTIETIARSAKSLPEVQKYMQEIMAKGVRAPQEYLAYRLPKEKADMSADFIDSAVELSGEDDELKDFYSI